eukprot:6655584-Alexandrium_andersonii.AAC.1
MNFSGHEPKKWPEPKSSLTPARPRAGTAADAAADAAAAAAVAAIAVSGPTAAATAAWSIPDGAAGNGGPGDV